MRISKAIGLAGTTLACVSAAQAAPIRPYVRAAVVIESHQIGKINHESGYLALPFASETNSASGSTPNGSIVSAAGGASADAFASLKVNATASATTVQPDFPAVHVVISAVAEWGDLFHFLPAPGATISFMETLEWSGPSSVQCPGDSCGVDIVHGLRGAPQGPSNDFHYDSSDPSSRPPPASQRVQQVWTFSNPATYDIGEVFALGISVFGRPSASFSADLSHTAHFYLDPITPGATYTTASGNLYLTPTVAAVPEPATTALLLAALPALALAARRKLAARRNGDARA